MKYFIRCLYCCSFFFAIFFCIGLMAGSAFLAYSVGYTTLGITLVFLTVCGGFSGISALKNVT